MRLLTIIALLFSLNSFADSVSEQEQVYAEATEEFEKSAELKKVLDTIQSGYSVNCEVTAVKTAWPTFIKWVTVKAACKGDDNFKLSLKVRSKYKIVDGQFVFDVKKFKVKL